MQTKVKWTGKMHFAGETENGTSMEMDTAPEHGGENRAPKPLEAVLMSLAGCTGMDVVSILRKMRQDFTGLEILSNGERVEDYPKKFRRIDLEFIVRGRHLDPALVAKAINLSHEKYCSVGAMLRPAVDIQVSWKIEEETADEVRAVEDHSVSV
ncbi:MAG: OsmC family protein [Bacteroidetes bacterium]|nr:OsmC family protein [Bacteroidota bacterium]